MHSSSPFSLRASWYVSKRNRRRRHKSTAPGNGLGPITDMPQDYVGQYRANDTPYGDGDPMSFWPDMSGNVNDAWQNDEDLQPTLQTVTFGGKTFHVVHFDSVDDGMYAPVTLAPELPFSIFVLWRPNAPAGDTKAIISSGSFDWSMGTFAGGMLCYFTNWTATGPINTSDFFLLEARITPQQPPYIVRLNGNACSLDPNAGSSGPDQITLGASGSNGYPAACDCAEIIIYNRCISDTEAAGVRTYFQSQYNYLKL